MALDMPDSPPKVPITPARLRMLPMMPAACCGHPPTSEAIPVATLYASWLVRNETASPTEFSAVSVSGSGSTVWAQPPPAVHSPVIHSTARIPPPRVFIGRSL